MLHKKTLISINPATLEKIGEVELTPIHDVDSMVESARNAHFLWKDTKFQERKKIFRDVKHLLLDRSEEIAKLITLEMGRPYAESLTLELHAGIDLIGYYVKNADRFLNDRSLPLHHLFFKRRKSRLHFQPLGVMGIITPWNWPLLIPLGFILPALLAGNGVVFKTSEITPLMGEAIRKLFTDAGLPKDLFQLIQGFGDAGRALVNASVDKIFFTGSTDVGKQVLEHSSRALKKVVLELGGSDPAIVCAGADIENVTSGIVWGAYTNCGQNCNSIERVYVHQSILEPFIQKSIEKMKQLRIGNGMESKTDLGPLASEKQLDKMQKLIRHARKSGAEILCGGEKVSHLPGYYFQPTLIHWDKSIPRSLDEEIFGPILLVTPVENDEEAITLANQSDFGLAASVWTKNLRQAEKIARRLEAGSVMVNDSVVSFGVTEASWTGVKNSGSGWVHGEKGIDEMVNIQYFHADSQYRSQKFWWFPYSDKMIRDIKVGLDFLFHRDFFRKLSAIPRLLASFTGYLLLNRKRKDKI